MKLLRILCAAFVTLSLVGCSKQASESNDSSIKVVATANPHAILLEEVKPLLKEKGYDLEIIETDDYYMPNEAVNSKDADANFFQHIPFFNHETSQNGYDLVSLGAVHIEPFGFYSKVVKDVNDLNDGATIIISNSIADHGRILAILEDHDLLTLKDGVDAMSATVSDIDENPLNLVFKEVKPELLVASFEQEEGDLVAINGNYAIQAGLNPSEDAVILETASSDNPYANIVACRSEDANNPKLRALIDALTSDTIKSFIESKWSNGSVLPVSK